MDSEQAMIMDVTRGGPLEKWFGGRGRGWGKSDLGGGGGVEEKVYQGKYTGKNPAWGKR